MSLRTSPALSLSRSPLVHVLVQVRFSPILQMVDYVPKLQESLRLEGFPLFNQEQTQTAKFLFAGPEVSTSTRWQFLAKDGVQGVVLANNFLTFEVAEYSNFEEFVNAFHKVADLVDTTVPGELIVQRVGLRYIDLVRNAKGLPVKAQLNEGLRGLSEEGLRESSLDVADLMYAFETRGTSPHGTLVVKLHQASDGSFLPPDLRQTSLSKTVDPPIEQKELVTILDFDHFSERQLSFEAATLIEHLWELHDYTDLAFRMAVTPEALALWGTNE